MRFGDGLGAYELDELPGCPQVAVSHAVFIRPFARGHGYGKAQHTARLKKLSELGFDYVICTVRSDNIREIDILTRNQWKPLAQFMSSASEGSIELWGRKIV